MITDTFDRLPSYHRELPWELMRDFLAKVDDRTPAGRVSLDDDRLHAVVDRYVPRPADKCVIEAHRRYIDVQVLLAGAEAIRVYDTARLTVTQAFDAARDVALFDASPAKAPVAAEVTLTPGRACVLLPEDAHMPGVAVPGAELPGVVKVVFKVASVLW